MIIDLEPHNDVSIDNRFEYRRQQYSVNASKNNSSIAEFLISHNIASSFSFANILIVGFCLLLFVGGFLIYSSTKKNFQVTFREDIPRDVAQKLSPELLATFPSKIEKK